MTSGLQGAVFPGGHPGGPGGRRSSNGDHRLPGDGDPPAAGRPGPPPLRVGGAVGAVDMTGARVTMRGRGPGHPGGVPVRHRPADPDARHPDRGGPPRHHGAAPDRGRDRRRARPRGRRWASGPAWWPTSSCPRPSGCRPWSAAWSASRWGWPPWPWTARAWWLPPLAALGASALYEVVYAAAGSVLGQPQMLHVDLLRIVVVVSVVNAVAGHARPSAWWPGPCPRPRPRGCPPRPGLRWRRCGEPGRVRGRRTLPAGRLGYWRP